MGLLIAPFGPLAEFWYFKDYWKPETFLGLEYSLEDLLFAFEIGGVSAVLYEEILGRQIFNERKHAYRWAILGLPAVILLTLILFNNVLNLNSIYASYLAFIAAAGLIIFFRHDLAKTALLSGVTLAVIAFIAYLPLVFLFPEIFQRFWFLHNISGITMGPIPIEEILWYLMWGFAAGPSYEFITGFGDRKLPRYNKKDDAD